jgi:hypothetical protein
MRVYSEGRLFCMLNFTTCKLEQKIYRKKELLLSVEMNKQTRIYQFFVVYKRRFM